MRPKHCEGLARACLAIGEDGRVESLKHFLHVAYLKELVLWMSTYLSQIQILRSAWNIG